MALTTIAILGRPNVGKSTLFNRLVGRRQALVDDTPGLTRDRIGGEARFGGLVFRLIDTAGLDDGAEGSLAARLRRQSEQALAEADLGLFVVDARAGLTPIDREIAAWLRRQAKPVLLLANKCEGHVAQAQSAEAWELGLGVPIAISAEHGDGLPDLVAALRPFMRVSDAEPELDSTTDPAEAARLDDSDEVAEEPPSGPLRLAVVGRPNVGKSSLINRLIADERLLTGPEPGLTRDAIRIAWEHDGRAIELVDTAGLRRKARIDDKLERMSVGATIGALRESHAVVLVVDATMPLEKQDLVIANLAIREGRALVVALNKWDLIEERGKVSGEIRDLAARRLPQVEGVALVPLSAMTGAGLDKLLPAVVAAETRWRRRVPTGALNRWLEGMLQAHPPPLVTGRRLKIRYATQARTRPPSFVLFANQPGELPESYLRYLARGLRQSFGLEGVPLRFSVRKSSKNPYVGA